jgi:CRP/FNR family cyclic AMP-dependent transcriptional regulator
VRCVLDDAGYSVIEADSGRLGLEKLLEHRPDVIILDIMMDTLEDGYGVTHSVKFQEAFAEFRSTPIIMVSSIQQTPDERFPRSEEVGMIRPDFYLTKPLDFPRFLELVREATRRSKRRQLSAQ